MSSDLEYRLSEAAKLVLTGVSKAQAAKTWSVSRSTLRRRIEGGVTRQQAHEPHQTLSQEQESFLCNWVLNEEHAGRAPTHKIVREFASLIVPAEKREHAFGRRWLRAFLRRHPAIRTKVGHKLEGARAEEAIAEAIHRFRIQNQRLIKRFSINQHNITNMDEHGFQQGDTKAGTVLGSSLLRRSEVKTSNDSTWASIIEAVTATGKRLTPVVIMKGTTLQGQWFPSPLPIWKYDSTDTGWSTSEIALRWLKEVYLPETKPEDPSEYRLLVLDEHSTHTTVDFMFTAYMNNVIIEYLPSHSSHLTQPLDVSVFGPVKEYYRQNTRFFASIDTVAPEQRRRFIIAYENASMKAISERNVIAGFRKAGIWPPGLQRATTPERIVDTDLPPVFPPVGFSMIQEQGDILVFQTPKTSQDIRKGAKQIQEQFGEVQRDLSLILRKVAKGMDLQTTKVASLTVENARLTEELKKYKPIPRKTVKKSAQDRFATIEEIVTARNEVERRRPTLEARVLHQHQNHDHEVDFPASFLAQDHQEQHANQ